MKKKFVSVLLALTIKKDKIYPCSKDSLDHDIYHDIYYS